MGRGFESEHSFLVCSLCPVNMPSIMASDLAIHKGYSVLGSRIHANGVEISRYPPYEQ